MKKEKIILSFGADIVGLLVAVVLFFFYQSTKKISSNNIDKIIINAPTPTPESAVYLTVDRPRDEEVSIKRTIAVSGKTVPGAKIIIATQSDQVAATPTKNGDFSTDITLDDGENILEVTAIATNGEVTSLKRVVTFSTESF